MRQLLVALLICLLAAPAAVAAKQATKARSHRPAASRAPAKRPSHRASSRTTRGRRRARGRGRAVARQTRPDPGRTREIQQALEREGYLTGPATGKWDEATQKAMARYQKDHGFTVTGKPDSRSLIKMGLGPNYERLTNPAPSPPRSSPSEN